MSDNPKIRAEKNAFVRAALEGDLGKVQAMLAATPEMLNAVYSENSSDSLHGKNALDAAIDGAFEKPAAERAGHLAVVSYLRERQIEGRNLAGALYSAVRECENARSITPQAKEKIEFLLSEGADPFQNMENGNNAFRTATRYVPDLALQFVEHDAGNMTLKDALKAASGNRPEIVAAIYKARPALACKVDENGQALIHAVVSDRALSSDIEERKRETLKVILANDPEAVNRVFLGKKPLHYACGESNPGISELLLNAGADVNEKDEKGNTPAHIAVRYNLKARINMKPLLEHGADLTATDAGGRTVREVAEEGVKVGHTTGLEMINSFAQTDAVSQAAAPIIAAVEGAKDKADSQPITIKFTAADAGTPAGQAIRNARSGGGGKPGMGSGRT